MNEIALEGCTATPLANYLKALGVLRLLSVKYPETRGCWRGDRFVLMTALDREGIKRFFLREYTPTPIISPWSGRAGFLEGDDGEGEGSKRKGAVILGKIEEATGRRFAKYRQVISGIRNVPVIQQLDQIRVERKRLDALRKATPKDKGISDNLSKAKRQEDGLKDALLRSLRNELDDSSLPWIDACFALFGDDRSPGPLLGSGGNEGSMDFSINHVGYLLELIDETTDEPLSVSTRLLGSSLFADTVPCESSSNIGFLDALASGGSNMSAGYEGSSTGNIWDSVLAMEGAVLFASLTTKRLESTTSGRPTFPFAVIPSMAGSGSLASKEKTRPELWLPTWNGMSLIAEVSSLLAEGRVTKGRNEARSGVDMLQAIAALGANRGITAFNRFGFYERRGRDSYVATHLGHFAVPRVAVDNWLISELNQGGWLDQFRSLADSKNAAKRFNVLRKRLEDALFALSGKTPSKPETQALLILLGEIQFSLGVRTSAKREKDEKPCPPIPRLSERWIIAADDDKPAFRIAKALAGLRGIGKVPLPMRAQLFPVHPKSGTWMEVAKKSAGARDDPACKYRHCDGFKGHLTDTLPTLLARRLWLAERFGMNDKPLDSSAGATLADLFAFLRDDSMDARIADLLPGLALCDIPQDIDRSGGEGAVPAAFALMKLALIPERTLRSLGTLADGQRLPVPNGMLAQLAAGNHGNRAVAIAWRRLRASGLAPRFMPGALPALAGINPQRAAAALLIPLRFGATGAMTRAVLKQSETETV